MVAILVASMVQLCSSQLACHIRDYFLDGPILDDASIILAKSVLLRNPIDCTMHAGTVLT